MKKCKSHGKNNNNNNNNSNNICSYVIYYINIYNIYKLITPKNQKEFQKPTTLAMFPQREKKIIGGCIWSATNLAMFIALNLGIGLLFFERVIIKSSCLWALV
jgi:hypothetical protein